jgi:hypothetical protein
MKIEWSNAQREVIVMDLEAMFSDPVQRKGLVAIVGAVDAYIFELKRRTKPRRTLRQKLLNG